MFNRRPVFTFGVNYFSNESKGTERRRLMTLHTRTCVVNLCQEKYIDYFSY